MRRILVQIGCSKIIKVNYMWTISKSKFEEEDGEVELQGADQ